MSDTPETDAYIGEDNEDYMTEGEIALCDFTRKLERERNELQEEFYNFRQNAKYRCHQLLNQRDELIQVLRDINKLTLCGKAHEEIENALEKYK